MSGAVYFLALLMVLGICVVGGMLAHRPKRTCPQCTRQIAQSARRCRHCGYEIE